MLAILLCGTAYGQDDPIKIGGRSVSSDGSVIYATDVSMLNLLGAAGEVNMSLQYREASSQWIILITVPYKEIDIPSNGTLTLGLSDGGSVSLPVEREMKWSRDRILVNVNKKDVYMMRIPYLATAEQMDILAKPGNVNQVTVVGSDRTISFRNRNVFSNIASRGQKEILAMMSEAPATVQITDTQQTIIASSDIVTSGKTIHKTDRTKFFEVNSLKDLKLSDCVDGHFIALEANKHQGYIFDSEGNLTGKIKVSRRYNGLFTILPVFSDGIALIAIEDTTPNTSDSRITAAIDYMGNIVSNVVQIGNEILYFPYKVVDGLIGVAYGYDSIRGGPDESTRYYISGLDLDKKIEVSSGSLIVSEDLSVYPHPVVDGRRLIHDKKFGYYDESGNIAIAPTYNSASDFSEGLAAVAVREGEQLMWGFIDVDGHMVIDPVFSNKPGDFHEGLAVVQKKNGQYVYIDKTGTVVSPEYAYASRFLGGYAYYTSRPKGEWYNSSDALVIDRNFKETGAVMTRHSFDKVPLHYNENNKVIFIGKDLVSDGYVYKSDGELLLSDVGPFFENLAWSKKNHCYVNLQGEIVLQFTESEF